MATTTPNFGWDIPQSTDLVKDGATAIAALGNDIDTSLVDLKGGTTGQVLSKASNTDMDFTWSDADPLKILDAKGDLITATAADTPARLALGTNGQFLQVDTSTSTGIKWAGAPSGNLKEVAFTSSNATWSIPSGVTGFWALVVGGGGGGGGTAAADSTCAGGAGGAGQVLEKYFEIAGGDTTLNITIGGGGAGASGTTRGSSGSASTIVGNTSATTYASAEGGGGGGAYLTNTTGLTGASGGGNGTDATATAGGGGGMRYPAAAQPTANWDRAGFDAQGGGADPTTYGVTGTFGGSSASNYGGCGVYVWARALGGGGNSNDSTASLGVLYGGGNSVVNTTPAASATANTGGGGAAARNSSSGVTRTGGAGGSGLVVLRYVGV